MSSSDGPILYSFRRCPYAIRARLALFFNKDAIKIVEVDLKNKPESLKRISPKATVPVLAFQDGEIIDESLDIVKWSFKGIDYILPHMDELVSENDNQFKYYLDRYKYFDRYPDKPQTYYREKAVKFLEKIENNLQTGDYLSGATYGFYDFCIFPFIRQFYNVDRNWFLNSKYKNTNTWLEKMMNLGLFLEVMKKK